MPYRRTYTNKYKRKNRIKKKWRQQKLAVGTVQKIAKDIAKKLDQQKIQYFYSNIFFAKDGYTWDSVNAICPSHEYRPIVSGALESQVLSDISNLLQLPQTAVANPDVKSITVGIKAVQARISIRNPNQDPIRFEAQIIYMPNLNDSTNDAVDFIRPDVFMLYKYGGGNLLYDGIAKKGITNKSSSLASARAYTVIARKTGTIRGYIATGQPEAGHININVARKNFTITKYFKTEKKHNCKVNAGPGGPERQFTDGNYYLIIFSDIALGGTSADPVIQQIEYCGAASIKLRIVGQTQPITT